MTTAVVLTSAACSREQPTRQVMVFAAASLSEAFAKFERDFEASHPGVDVVINLGPSSGLATQIRSGAPADVFASASPEQTDGLTKDGFGPAGTVFARNTLTVALAPGNPGHITKAADLTASGARVAICAEEVPCGRLAARWQKDSGLTLHPLTREVDVKGVLNKVASREANAGLVYRTDVKAASAQGVTEMELPQAPSTNLVIMTLNKAPQADLAREFSALVTSSEGRSVLAEQGFK